MSSNQGVYILRNFVKDRHTFFAIDNCDFQEDTKNGKNTLHGTVINIYQKCDIADVCQPLVIDNSTNDTRLFELPG